LEKREIKIKHEERRAFRELKEHLERKHAHEAAVREWLEWDKERKEKETMEGIGGA
jgi:hypothetical protein